MSTPCIITVPPPAAQVADEDITAAVQRLLRTTRGVRSRLVEVATHGGVVALSGCTNSLLARQRTEGIALAVRGVRGVASTLAIQPADVPDAQLRHDVEQALADDPATDDYDVRCEVAAGIVAPHGTVRSWAEQQLVLRVLAAVRGVRRVEVGHLHIGGGEVRNSDEEMTIQIRALLDWDLRVDGTRVRVRTTGQHVHLTGTVGTAAEHAHVVTTAYQAGAARVEARTLRVAPQAREPGGTPFVPRADADVARAVREALSYSSGVLLAEPLVQAHGGVVTLAGTVASLRARLGAEHEARHVAGVVGVHNLLKVRPGRIVTDAVVEQAVAAALARHPDVGHCALGVQVHEGKACLRGQVGSYREWRQAGDVAAGVRGVLELDNQTTVPPPAECTAADSAEALGFQPSFLGEDALSPSQPAGDAVLAARIRSRYCWSAALHDQQVDVAVEAGRATLTGTVDTWLDRRQATREAYEAGAGDVDNRLHVTTAPWLEVETRVAQPEAVAVAP